MTHAFITGVGASEDLEVRFRTTGGPMTMHERTWLVSNDLATAGATFAEDEDTKLTGLARQTTRRLRFEMVNLGTDTTGTLNLRLEVSEPNPASCAAATYTRVDSSAHWNMVTSTHFADGDATNNIDPGLTDAVSTFVTGELKESDDETGDIIITSGQFTEVEFAVQATSGAIKGADYCFRLTDAGATTLLTYTVYGEVQLSPTGALRGAIMEVD